MYYELVMRLRGGTAFGIGEEERTNLLRFLRYFRDRLR